MHAPHNVPVAYRAPFTFGEPWRDARPEGESILDIVRSVPDLPRQFLAKGYVCINGEEVPRQLWSYVRPRPATASKPICVTLHWPLGSPGGGGRGTLKSVIGLVAALALIVITGGIAGGFLGVPGLFGGAFLFGAGSTSALLLAGAVGIAGALAISALTAPPSVEQPQIGGATGGDNVNNLEAASASGNVINPGGSIPRVIGTRKIFPPLGCEPVVELVDQDEFVEALLILNGPHLLDDIRIDGNVITEAEDVTFETREGWPSDTPITAITRQGRTSAPQIELSQFKLANNGTDLAHQALPEGDLPVWHGISSRSEPDQIWIHLLLPGGLGTIDTTQYSLPLRIRFRLRGASPTTWVNVPEVHISDNTTQQVRRAILFKWQTAEALSTNPIPSTNGFVYANINVPPQIPAPATPTDLQWDANAYFDDGAGSDYAFSGVESSSRVRNIGLFQNRLEIYMDETIFPKGIYEIEIKRGAAFETGTFTGTTYEYSGTVYDFFWYNGTSLYQIAAGHSSISDRCLLTRIISIWDEHPVAKNGFALIAIKARNRQISRVSVSASGYVRDWSGSAWDTWTTTSNPAPHYVDVLSGAQNLDPLPSDLRDDTGLVAWRTLCASENWTCDAIIDDMRTQDALSLIASCAYARPYQSDQYGVTVDSDVSANSPVQVFSRLNASNMKYEKAFARVPEGFVVSFRDNAEDDDRAQTVVYQRDRSIATTGLLESISYEGLIDQSKVEARALFDLDQANSRSTFYSFDTDIESIVCRRGSLVALQHDVLTSRSGDAHIKTKTTSGSPLSITGFMLDSFIPITNELDMHAVTDMHLVADMHDVGITTGIAIRRTDGTISTHQLSNVTGESSTITLTTPITDVATIVGYDDTSDEYGCLLVCGQLNSEYLRMLVLSITPSQDLKASMVLVNEAPELVRF